MPTYKGFYGKNYKGGKKLSFGQVKQVQKIVNSNKRLKHFYYAIDNPYQINPGAGGTNILTSFDELTRITVGSGSAERDSEYINLQSVNLKMALATNTNDATVPRTSIETIGYRVIIVRSKSGPVADILDRTNVTIIDWSQQPDPDLYQVLHDEIFNPIQAAGIPGLGYLQKFYKSFKNKKVPHMVVRYDDNGADPVASINNGLFMKVILDPTLSPTGITNFKLLGHFHLKWYDKE